jgi:hypothetical protein
VYLKIRDPRLFVPTSLFYMVMGSAPETWITWGTTLLPSLFPILSRRTRAAQVVRAASPRATRMIQRCVVGEKYFTACREEETSLVLFFGEAGGKNAPASEPPTSPQPLSPKFTNTLCFSALNTSFPDIAWAEEAVVVVAGMNSTRSQRFWFAGLIKA